MKKKWTRRGLLLALLILGGGLFFRWSQESIVTPTYIVTSPDLPEAFDGFRIVHISDLHGKEFGENNRRLIEAVVELEPDLIAITGDLIDQQQQATAVLPELMTGLLTETEAKVPICYVTGNHEWAVRNVSNLKDFLEFWGVRALSNEYAVLERQGEKLVIAGVDDPNGPADQKTPEELRAEITEEMGETYTVFLSHRDTVEAYAELGFDLTLCGHGHGGIVRIPILDQGVLSTSRDFFPEYDGGLYTFENGAACVVSRGLGSNTVPIRAFRLFNRPDLPLIILSKGA